MEETLEKLPDSPELETPGVEGEPAPEPKRGRGRPRKTQIPEADVIPRKAKDAKPSSKKEEEKNTNQTAEFFAQQIFGIHTLASLVTGMDLMIDAKGAASMGAAVYEVVKQYDLSWLNKFTPVMNLIVTTAIVEGPVILKAQAQAKAKRAEKQEAQVLKSPATTVEQGPPLKATPQASGIGQAQPGIFNPQVIQGGGPFGSVNVG